MYTNELSMPQASSIENRHASYVNYLVKPRCNPSYDNADVSLEDNEGSPKAVRAGSLVLL
jgi:hypothetical protein